MIFGTSYHAYVAQGLLDLARYLAVPLTHDAWHGWTGEHP